MPNPLISQGTLNRLRGSVQIPLSPQLNVTAPYLGDAGISLSLDGDTTAMLPALTGVVTSPEPYQMATVSIALLKTNGLADLYKDRIEVDSLIGDIIVSPDTTAMKDYIFTNCSIQSVREMSFAGKDAVMMVTLQGTYNINANLWDAE